MQRLIHEIRERLNVSQDDMARMIGTSCATVNRWENGRSRPGKAIQLRLYDVCREEGLYFDEIHAYTAVGQFACGGDGAATAAAEEAVPVSAGSGGYGGFASHSGCNSVNSPSAKAAWPASEKWTPSKAVSTFHAPASANSIPSAWARSL